MTTQEDKPRQSGLKRRSTVLLTASAQAQSQTTSGTLADAPLTLRVNGQAHSFVADVRTTLLDALRENIGLTGSKKGCDHGQCGACTVHVDGRRILGCLTLAVSVQGKEVTTIEGFAAQDGTLHPMQETFIEHEAFQCGYCTPGQIMSAVATLRPGELIVALVIPAGPHTMRSAYVKVRDRQSYAFAIASAAVALDIGSDGIVRDARVGLGAIHYAPYRAEAAEAVLRGPVIDDTSAAEAATAAVQGTVTHGHNDYKPELAHRTLVRALIQVRDMPVAEAN